MNRPLIAYILIMLLVVSVAVSMAWYSASNHVSSISTRTENRTTTGLGAIFCDAKDKECLKGNFCVGMYQGGYVCNNLDSYHRPIAVVLDFGNQTQFIDENFSNRFYSDLLNASSLHPSVLIIRMNSDGGVGYRTGGGWMWFPIEVGRMIRLFNATSWFYVPTQCISGCWLVSSFATVIAGPGINDFNHTRAEVGNATYDWAYGISSHNNMDGRGIRLATPEYHTNWTTFIAQFSSYQIKTIRA